MACMLFTYKGLHFDPPLRFETVYGEMIFTYELQRELDKRGLPWSDGISKVLDEYRKRHSGDTSV